MIFAGFLRKAPVEMVRCKTVDLEAPAHSEIVLEGYVDPHERRIEGPFGDHTGYYSPADEYPVFHLTAITHRQTPSIPATIVGKPPMEDCFLGKATERIFLPLIKSQLPEIVDMNLPVEGIFHNLAFVSIRKRYPMQAQKVINALWGLGQMMFTKIIVVFDEDVDVQNMSEVLWRLGSNIDPRRDVTFSRGAGRCARSRRAAGAVRLEDGYRCHKEDRGENHHRDWPEDIMMSPEVVEKIDGIWGELGIG